MGGYKALGEACRKARRGKGLGIREAEKATGVSFSYIWQIEAGRRNPSIQILEKLAAGYGTTVTRLLHDAGIK